jgi:hypothetical protein
MATSLFGAPCDEAGWPKLRISTVRTDPVTLTQAAVQACFERGANQHDVLQALYRLVLPEFDQVASLDGWPTVNGKTWCMIGKLFIDFDKKHHPGVFAGGLWMNRGFSTVKGDRLPDWCVSLADVVIHWKEGAA